MIIQWIKKHLSMIVVGIIGLGFMFYSYGCEPKVKSLIHDQHRINRQELQLELDQLINMAQLRMADLDKQEQFRSIILQNALILVQGQPLNPVGIITAFAAVYGAMQGGRTITKVVKKTRDKRNNKETNNA